MQECALSALSESSEKHEQKKKTDVLDNKCGACRCSSKTKGWGFVRLGYRVVGRAYTQPLNLKTQSLQQI